MVRRIFTRSTDPIHVCSRLYYIQTAAYIHEVFTLQAPIKNIGRGCIDHV